MNIIYPIINIKNVAFPFQQPARATITPVSSASSLPAEPDGCEEMSKRCAEEKGEARQEGERKRNSVTEQSGEIIVEEVDGGTTSTDLSGWQVGKRKAVDWRLGVTVHCSFIMVEVYSRYKPASWLVQW